MRLCRARSLLPRDMVGSLPRSASQPNPLLVPKSCHPGTHQTEVCDQWKLKIPGPWLSSTTDLSYFQQICQCSDVTTTKSSLPPTDTSLIRNCAEVVQIQCVSCFVGEKIKRLKSSACFGWFIVLFITRTPQRILQIPDIKNQQRV